MNLSLQRKHLNIYQKRSFLKKVGLLHGKLSSQEKNEVINSF